MDNRHNLSAFKSQRFNISCRVSFRVAFKCQWSCPHDTSAVLHLRTEIKPGYLKNVMPDILSYEDLSAFLVPPSSMSLMEPLFLQCNYKFVFLCCKYTHCFLPDFHQQGLRCYSHRRKSQKFHIFLYRKFSSLWHFEEAFESQRIQSIHECLHNPLHFQSYTPWGSPDCIHK